MRLIIISNRLPITIQREGNELSFQASSGGLVSGISAYLDSLNTSSFSKTEHIWVGWPGLAVEEADKSELRDKLLNEYNAFPVFLSETEMEKFYLGFCNKTIWPLFHYFPSYTTYDEDQWNNYQSINKTFAETLLEIIKPGDVVWVHDYHLMLLPALLREKISNPIGFFLHIPFPTYEIFRLLPEKWRTDILTGLLGADLLGFHTDDYTKYFFRSVRRILGYEESSGEINIDNHVVRAETFPMGIDFKRFIKTANSQKVKNEKIKLQKTLSNFKTILSIDRLDYTKGIVKRLEGFENFLDKYPEWHSKLILILIVVPSRIGVDQYQLMKSQIDELVGKINGRFGSINWTPILYQYKFISFQPLVALYGVSDIALITPLRDGMNLIAKEYISSRKDKTGVLILSEMAGASRELKEAIIMNPNNAEEVAESIKLAADMPVEEQIRRNEIMQMRLEKYDVTKWADDFITKLKKIKKKQKKFDTNLLNNTYKSLLISDFKNAKKRLIFLDYDGTLVPFADDPKTTKPDNEVLEILNCLAEDKKNDVVIISGRDKEILQAWFNIPNINLVAEHGIWIKEKNRVWEIQGSLTNSWKGELLPLLKIYTSQVPNSFIEEKDFSIVWHYRAADSDLASEKAKELINQLTNYAADFEIQVMNGNKVVEVINANINKGSAAQRWTLQNDYDFILAIGDDLTDEKLFKALHGTAYTIKVGLSKSYAKFNLQNHIEVKELLQQLLS
ncbi:MAG TPA: bifunctional alpha,alpha-trehalose-phosphate synthase (UDP-forming)/trehalose-phosphatase [Ignavibacteriaceae bacterium]|nr:bifunctional alpha,alpha-trehalose-phosphate synthase (UDP-forming)/trehalose-phosphatase [Ignavibacteriaceae bacterium]